MARPLLVPASPPTDRPLLVVIAIIVAIAVIAAGVTRFTYTATASWVAGVEGGATIQVQAREGETAVQTAQAAGDALLTEPSLVTGVKVYSPSEIADMLEPWFGEDGLPENAPLPGLLSVTAETFDEAAMLARLNQRRIDAQIDLHAVWSKDVKRAGFVLRAIATFTLGLMIAGAVFVIIYASRASLSARADIVDVMHVVGAREGFIAGQFTRRFAKLGIRAGVVGALLALMIGSIAVWGLSSARDLGPVKLVPQFEPAWADMIIVGAAPLLAGLIAALVARVTVIASLKRRY